MEADAKMFEEVTNKLSKAVHGYRDDGTLGGVPVGEIGISIGEALESVVMVSKVSK